MTQSITVVGTPHNSEFAVLQSKVMDLAQDVERCRFTWRAMQSRGTPTETKDIIASAARERMAFEAMLEAERNLSAAIKGLSAEDLSKIALL